MCFSIFQKEYLMRDEIFILNYLNEKQFLNTNYYKHSLFFVIVEKFFIQSSTSTCQHVLYI